MFKYHILFKQSLIKICCNYETLTFLFSCKIQEILASAWRDFTMSEIHFSVTTTICLFKSTLLLCSPILLHFHNNCPWICHKYSSFANTYSLHISSYYPFIFKIHHIIFFPIFLQAIYLNYCLKNSAFFLFL